MEDNNIQQLNNQNDSNNANRLQGQNGEIEEINTSSKYNFFIFYF